MKTIDRQTYLQALALYFVAKNKANQLMALESELDQLLDEDGGHVSDALFERLEPSEPSFQEALRKAKIKVV